MAEITQQDFTNNLIALLEETFEGPSPASGSSYPSRRDSACAQEFRGRDQEVILLNNRVLALVLIRNRTEPDIHSQTGPRERTTAVENDTRASASATAPTGSAGISHDRHAT